MTSTSAAAIETSMASEALEGPGSSVPGLPTSGTPEERPVVVKGRIGGRPLRVMPLPRRGEVRRYLLTSAQNNTHVHEALWVNGLALAAHYDAELLVGTYTYNKAAYGSKAVKRGTKKTTDAQDLWYDPQVVEHVCDESVQLAPNLVWCGEQNILPTAEHPLSKMEAYNGRASNLVPHAKFAMQAVAGMAGEGTKHNYTTGTVTQRNYIQKKIGMLAEQYHGYGFLLVEVCGDGSWFVRQIQATEEGVLRDFDLRVEDGEVTAGNPVEAITWGDVHVRVVDPEVRELAWGKGGMLDSLRPRVQLVHDILDQRARNHHEAKDPIAGFCKWKAEQDSVEAEIDECVEWLICEATRPWCDTVVVPSNHHEALERWVKDADWKKDPPNAEFYLQAALALLGGETDLFTWAMRRAMPLEWKQDSRVRFLSTDEPLVLAGVEVGQHGHMGINGARGNGKAFSRLGRPATTAHEHTAMIHLWNWVAGTSTKLRIGYNRGPSSWSHSHVVHYPEGTRTMVTMWKGRWRA